MKKYVALNDQLYQYLQDVSLREHSALTSLRHITESAIGAHMQIPPEEGQFLALLVKLSKATRVLELGTFKGYSALAIALALPENGLLITCDTDNRYIDLATLHWKQADVAHKIQFQLGDANETLEKLIDAHESFDAVFIDADKTSYDIYYEKCLTLLKPGGWMAIDNVLREGFIIDEADQTPGTQAIRILNKKIHSDERVELCVLNIGDGVTLVRKR